MSIIITVKVAGKNFHNKLAAINFFISLVVQSITTKLDIQVLYGKYYLCNKSWYHATENSV